MSYGFTKIMRLILFDIDGTLIRSHGAGREAMRAALEEVCGTAGPIDSYKMSGKIDNQILLDLLTAAQLPKERIHALRPEIYAAMAKKGQTIFWDRNITACPGAAELLPRLWRQEGIILGLLTGNSQMIAPLKLKAAGLNPTLFRVCVYGSDAETRNEMPQIAYERAQKLTGQAVDGKNTVIIGDTPADILCARAGLATAVAVASGWHSAQTLSQYQPDFLLNDLRDTDGVVKLLCNGQLNSTF